MPARRKVSYQQLEALIAALEADRELAVAAVTGEGGPMGKASVTARWEALADRLNAIGTGVEKTASEWRAYWHGEKYKARKRAAEVKALALKTGGGPPPRKQLTDHQLKIISLLGNVSVYGNEGTRIPFKVNDYIGDLGPRLPEPDPPAPDSPAPDSYLPEGVAGGSGLSVAVIVEELDYADIYEETPAHDDDWLHEVEIPDYEEEPLPSQCSVAPRRLHMDDQEDCPIPVRRPRTVSHDSLSQYIPSAPTTQQSVPTPQPSVLAPRPLVLAPRPSVPAPRPSVATPRPSVATPRPSVATPRPSVPTPRPSVATPRLSVPTPRPKVATPQPSVATPRPSVATPRPSVATPRPSVPTPRPSVPTPRPSVPTPRLSVATPRPSVPALRPPASAPQPPPAAPQNAPRPYARYQADVPQWALDIEEANAETHRRIATALEQMDRRLEHMVELLGELVQMRR